LATLALAMVPPAPPRLTITTGCPSASCSFAPIVRAMKSAAPPGGTGSTMEIGRVG
jgi:hypothetical protein